MISDRWEIDRQKHSQIITILIFKIKMDRDAIKSRDILEGTDGLYNLDTVSLAISKREF